MYLKCFRYIISAALLQVYGANFSVYILGIAAPLNVSTKIKENYDIKQRQRFTTKEHECPVKKALTSVILNSSASSTPGIEVFPCAMKVYSETLLDNKHLSRRTKKELNKPCPIATYFVVLQILQR